LAAAALLLLAACGDKDVVADTFEIKHRLDGDRLYLALDTDLPDFPDVTVSVRRDYRQKNHPIVYEIHYLYEETTVGAWRKEREVVLDNAEWKRKMQAEQEKYRKMLTPLNVESISDEVAVKIVLPLRQRDPRMGDRNANLKGKAVGDAATKIVTREVKLPFPLN
jgi:hypothetical protein